MKFGPLMIDTFGRPLSFEEAAKFQRWGEILSLGKEKEFNPDQPRDELGRWTSDGAEAPPTRELGTVAFGYSGEVVPGNTRIVWRSDTPKAVVDNVKAGLKFLRSKGDMRIGNVIIDPDDPTFQETPHALAVTYAWADGEHTEVRINPEAWQRDEENPTPGWFSSDSPNHTIVHENGHIVNRGMTTGDLPGARARPLDPEQKAAAATVSRYATANSDEFMAETYAAKMLGEPVSPEAQSLYDAIQNRAPGETIEGVPKTKEFDPDQPRDELGRWTSEGGGGAFAVPDTLVNMNEQIMAADQHMILPYRGWADSLSTLEADAVVEWAASSDSINRWLRGEKPNQAQHDQPYVKDWTLNLDKALAKASAPEDYVAYRGIEAQIDLKPGDTFVDKGFVATSMSRATAVSFSGLETVFKINVPHGSNAAYVTAVTRARDEGELLLPRGSKFTVKSVSQVESFPGADMPAKMTQIEVDYAGYSGREDVLNKEPPHIVVDRKKP